MVSYVTLSQSPDGDSFGSSSSGFGSAFNVVGFLSSFAGSCLRFAPVVQAWPGMITVEYGLLNNRGNVRINGNPITGVMGMTSTIRTDISYYDRRFGSYVEDS